MDDPTLWHRLQFSFTIVYHYLFPQLTMGLAWFLVYWKWLSGYFIIVTNAFMQHPLGHGMSPDGTLHIADLGAYLGNPWAWVEFAHNQAAALVTGAFAVAAIGAFYTLRDKHRAQASMYLK